ncbi:DsbA family protein [Pedobacter glucosidilyticus]|uniref:DsbA family protein n=1 Tax=Pedobacter glucosidilyticus TaxID=1122941 RepID=UPI0026F2D41A|nr:DsbA family protein [Pedobacter glucosidilyticus]
MENKKPSIIYVYDAICGWCYGFSPVMKSLFDNYSDTFDFEVLSGGMMMGEREGTINDVAPYIKTAYKDVENATGVKFGEAFLTELEKGDLYLSSEKPAIALSVFKSYFPEKAILFAHDLQSAIYVHGLDLRNDESYVYLAEKYQIPAEEFIKKLNQEEFKQAAYYDFALARQLQVTGYPAAFIRTGELKFYMIAKGYANLETMELRVQNVLKEIAL